MSDYQKALNEIQSLFTQTGIPSGQAQDITQRLTVALSSYFDYRAGISSGATSTNESGNTDPSYLNQFRAREAGPATSQTERAGKDGLNGWGFGVSGAAGATGADGQSGQQGESGTSGRDGRDGSGAGIDIKKEIDDLKKQIEELGKKVDSSGGCPKCCKGKFRGQDPCAIAEQQANELNRLRRKLGLPPTDPNKPDPLEEQVKEIQKQLDEAVECP
jgi:hypothetical protein